MWRYKYRREFFPDDGLVEGCNALGDEGWSLIGPPRWVPPEPGVDLIPDDPEFRQLSLGVWACFFKRTVSNREQIRQVFALSPQEARP